MSSEPSNPGQSDGRLVLVPGDLSEVSRATEAFESFASERGLSVRVTRRTEVILDEILNNVLSYGGARHGVELEVVHSADRLVIRFADTGAPFNPLARETPDTSASLEDRVVGGLGIHLVRKLADEVSYQRQNGRNVLTVCLWIVTDSESS